MQANELTHKTIENERLANTRGVGQNADGCDWKEAMTRSELIDLMADGQSQLSAKDVELAVKLLIDHMSETLSSGQRIEIRGFGSFSLHYREPREGRNPRTGDTVALRGKHVPHFKPGKELRERVNRAVKSGF